MLVHPLVQLESLVSVRKVLFGQFFVFMLRFDPIGQLCSFVFILGISGLVSLESFVTSFFFLAGSLWELSFVTALRTVPPAIIATLAMLYTNVDIFLEAFFGPQGIVSERWPNVVHHIGAWVGGEVFFDCLFCNSADASGQAGRHCSIENGFDKPIYGHGCIYLFEKLFLRAAGVFCLTCQVLAFDKPKAKRDSTARVSLFALLDTSQSNCLLTHCSFLMNPKMFPLSFPRPLLSANAWLEGFDNIAGG